MRRLFAGLYAAREWADENQHRLPGPVLAAVDIAFDWASGVPLRTQWRERRATR